MGVDFFPCDECGESICDCGTWWECDTCGHRLCEDCDREHVEMDADGESVCPYCDDKLVTDLELLDFAIELLEVDRDELTEMYFAKKKNIDLPE